MRQFKLGLENDIAVNNWFSVGLKMERHMKSNRCLRPALLLASFIGLVMAGWPGNTRAALRNGALAPDFTAPAALGGKEFRFSMADALKHGPVVLYFYPAAFTRGCTVEAHDFAEATPAFKALGATVIGVSGDNIDTLKSFSVSEMPEQVPSRRRHQSSGDEGLRFRPHPIHVVC